MLKATAPLRRKKVIEFCTVASGPYCGMLLSDFGADVIKVERPGSGDSLRSWPPFTEGYSENFASLNRNKRSIALDLKNVNDHKTALDLVAEADVVIENNRPGVMQRLGLDYETVRRSNPAIVYCSISAFGQEGPRNHQAGFDLTVQAMSGIMSVTGEPDRPPVKSGVPISDFATGLYAAFSVSSMLHRVNQTGEGAHIDISMLGASLGISALQTSQLFGGGGEPERLGAAHPRNAPYEVFKCANGNVAIAAGNNSLFDRFCRVIHCEFLLADSRFSETSSRARHQTDLKAYVEKALSARMRDELLEALAAAGVPCAPINTYSEAIEDPQVKAQGWVQDLDLPGGSVTQTFGSPVAVNGTYPYVFAPPPNLDEHREQILQELELKTCQSEPAT